MKSQDEIAKKNNRMLVVITDYALKNGITYETVKEAVVAYTRTYFSSEIKTKIEDETNFKKGVQAAAEILGITYEGFKKIYDKYDDPKKYEELLKKTLNINKKGG